MFADCPHCSRRDFLGRIGGGFGAGALGALIQQARAASAPAVTIDPVSPFLPRTPHFAPRAKSVIFLYMVGGPSHVDTFDYNGAAKLGGKPAPAHIKEALKKRGTRMSSSAAKGSSRVRSMVSTARGCGF